MPLKELNGYVAEVNFITSAIWTSIYTVIIMLYHQREGPRLVRWKTNRFKSIPETGSKHIWTKANPVGASDAQKFGNYSLIHEWICNQVQIQRELSKGNSSNSLRGTPSVTGIKTHHVASIVLGYWTIKTFGIVVIIEKWLRRIIQLTPGTFNHFMSLNANILMLFSL